MGRGVHEREPIDDVPPQAMDFIALGCPSLLPEMHQTAHNQLANEASGHELHAAGGIMRQPIPDNLGDEDEGKCVVCLDHDATHAIIPCGHRCVCQEHAEMLIGLKDQLCPVCRVSIRGSLRVYM